jgi:hypothetical protein
MKVVTVRDFRDRASEMFRSDDVILVTRDGAPAGFSLPWDTPELPVEVRREVFLRLSLRDAGNIEEPAHAGAARETTHSDSSNTTPPPEKRRAARVWPPIRRMSS